MTPIAISSQNCTRGPIQCNQSSKRNKRHKDYVERNKTIIICRWHECICRRFKIIYSILKIHKWFCKTPDKKY